jgi:hypothetical protein
VPPHLAGIPAVGRYWQSRAIAQRTVVLCIVTMAELDDLLIRSWAFTSQRTGEKFVRCYCVTSPCAYVVKRQGAWLQPRSSTISYRSKRVAHALTDPTCSLSASLATTARRPERLPVGVRPPRGVNLYDERAKMRAPAQIFTAAKFTTPYHPNVVRSQARKYSDAANGAYC